MPSLTTGWSASASAIGSLTASNRCCREVVSHGVCFQHSSTYRVLPFGLSLSPCLVSTQRADTTLSSFGRVCEFPDFHCFDGFFSFLAASSTCVPVHLVLLVSFLTPVFLDLVCLTRNLCMLSKESILTSHVMFSFRSSLSSLHSRSLKVALCTSMDTSGASVKPFFDIL